MKIAGSDRYLNRELSWLAFNGRVLDEAGDATNRLLERVRYLGIVARNLDEFFEVRVAGLLQQAEAGIDERGPDGLGPDEQLATGNYNHSTALAYTDLGLFTADPGLTRDVAEVFNVLTSLSPKPALRRLLVAPFDLLIGTVSRIEREAAHARAGRRESWPR